MSGSGVLFHLDVAAGCLAPEGAEVGSFLNS